MEIPFNRSSLQGRELEYITQTITIGQIAGDQTFSKKCHALLESTLNVPRALVTTSCTHALEMAALLLNLQPGDEVIVPDFAFVSTANAFVLHGATPVFCDIRPDTLNLDETRIEALITPRTRAIVPLHYAGVACEMDVINAIAARYGVAVVEDNAHGLFGKYKGRWLGTLGGMAAQSFHETKNITCGEGGALIINDEKYLNRAEIIREKGTNRARFFRGQMSTIITKALTELGVKAVPSRRCFSVMRELFLVVQFVVGCFCVRAKLWIEHTHKHTLNHHNGKQQKQKACSRSAPRRCTRPTSATTLRRPRRSSRST